MLCACQLNLEDHLTWSSGYIALAKSVDIGKSNTLPFFSTFISSSKTKGKDKKQQVANSKANKCTDMLLEYVLTQKGCPYYSMSHNSPLH